jgi:hypothetical protein
MAKKTKKPKYRRQMAKDLQLGDRIELGEKIYELIEVKRPMLDSKIPLIFLPADLVEEQKTLTFDDRLRFTVPRETMFILLN